MELVVILLRDQILQKYGFALFFVGYSLRKKIYKRLVMAVNEIV